MIPRFSSNAYLGHRLIALMRLATRNVARQRSRTMMALAAIGLGVAAIVVAGGFIRDVYLQFAEAIIHSQYGHLQVYRSGYTDHGTQHPAEYLIDSPQALIERLERIEGVKAVLPRLRFVGTANAGGADLPLVGEGGRPAVENQLGTAIHVIEGRPLNKDDRNVVVVGAGLAKALKVHPGMPLSINIATREGALNTLEFEVAGVFQSHSKEFDERTVRLPLEAAQELLATEGVNEIAVELSDSAFTEQATNAARAALEGEGYEIKRWRDLADFYDKTVQLFDRQFGFLQVVLLLMIVLSVSNTINMATFERLPEFGTMLALGDRGRDVFRLIMTECLVLGIVGSLLGLLLGVLLALAISTVGIDMPPPPNADLGYTASIQVVPSILTAAFAVGTVAATLAGIAPSRKIARTPAVEALRRAV